MAKLTLTINSENDALTGDESHLEMARILRTAAAKLEEGYNEGRLYDTNGNKVGTFEAEFPETDEEEAEG